MSKVSVEKDLELQININGPVFERELEGYHHGISDYECYDSERLARMPKDQREAYRLGYSQGFQDKKLRH